MKEDTDLQDITPSKKTSAVPLRKETVRVTLKATPGQAGAPPAPGAPAPPSPPGAAASSAPKAPVPAPTVPLTGPTTAKAPMPAPTVPLTTAGAGTKPVPAPAPTVKLNTPSATAGGPGTAALTTGPATVPLTGSGSSQPLPKATVQLQQTQPLGTPAPSQAATIQTAEDDAEDADKGAGLFTGLSIAAMIIALAVLGLQLATANVWVNDESRDGAPGWGRLFE